MQKHSIKICCFIGHRKIEITVELKQAIYEYVESLIVNENVKVFLFGSRSKFDDPCYEVVSGLQEKYPYIERVYVRSQYEYVGKDYESYLLQFYEKTTYPESCIGAGKLSHIKRNQAMIDQSDFCLFYYDENYLPPKRKWAKRDLFAYQQNQELHLPTNMHNKKRRLSKISTNNDTKNQKV